MPPKDSTAGRLRSAPRWLLKHHPFSGWWSGLGGTLWLSCYVASMPVETTDGSDTRHTFEFVGACCGLGAAWCAILLWGPAWRLAVVESLSLFSVVTHATCCTVVYLLFCQGSSSSTRCRLYSLVLHQSGCVESPDYYSGAGRLAAPTTLPCRATLSTPTYFGC